MITLILPAFLLFVIKYFGVVDCIILSSCEIEAVLLRKVESNEVGNWICLAKVVSQSNTSKFIEYNINTRNYGIFQISDNIWCSKINKTNLYDSVCRTSCTKFLDDDISDDIACALQIYRVSYNFKFWPQWEVECQGRNENYISKCNYDTTRVLTSPHAMKPTNGSIKTILPNTENQHLLCMAKGYPKPELEWIYNKTLFQDTYTILTSKGLFLFFSSNMSSIPEAVIKCQANNPKGRAIALVHIKNGGREKQEEVGEGNDDTSCIDEQIKVGINPCSGGRRKFKKPDASTSSTFTVGLLCGLGIACLFICLACTYKICRRASLRQNARNEVPAIGLTKDEIAEFNNGDPDGVVFDAFAHENARFQPYNKHYEIPAGQLIFDTNKLLGSGAFGLVYKGEYNGVLVAVKTIRPMSDKAYITALLSELKIMIFIGQQEHVVNLIGAQTTELEKGSASVIVEYCGLGSLEHYLRSNKLHFKNTDTPNTYSNVGNILPVSYQNITSFSSKDLNEWSVQIASGMKYLASKKVIHGDLATRNVLLTSHRKIKITDFGLSRQLYEYTEYVKKNQAPLPWRWMAIESLRSMTFSPQSDVWSFGVTLWELFNLGDVPYPGLTWSLDFAQQLESGLRLLQPKYASNEMYENILSCWHHSPADRPDMSTLYDTLNITAYLEGSETK